jgi:hypothetical protein
MKNAKQLRLATEIFAMVFLFGPAALQAQRAMPLGPAHPSSTVRVRPAQTNVVARPSAPRKTSTFTAGMPFNASANNGFAGFGGFDGFGGSPLSVQDLLNPVPGFGFDFSHLAAINGDLGIKAVIDPATEWRLAVAERLLRDNRGFVGGGYILDGGGAYVVPQESTDTGEPAAAQPAPQPQIIVVQGQASGSQPAAESQPAPAPVPDVGQFTLVLRNGTQVQAVAVTRGNDLIIYITPDGSRRTIAAASLDSDATLRLNQERGTPLNLSL